tara:strand:+ start:359 stop:817 length:459 start_codon:yes stop_codon:yes gene_type:complete
MSKPTADTSTPTWQGGPRTWKGNLPLKGVKDMESIQIENMPGTFIEVIETSTAGYIVGVVHIEASLLVERTDAANTYLDWSEKFAAGAYGLLNLLTHLRWLASDMRGEFRNLGEVGWSDDLSEDRAKAEFLEDLMAELAGLRQDEYRAAAAE